MTYHLFIKQYLCRQIIQKRNLTMEIISIERSTYEVIDFVASLVEELLTSFNSFVSQMMAMGSRGTDKRLGEWLDNQDICQILNISPRTLQTLRQNGTLAYSQIELSPLLKSILGLRFGNLTPSSIFSNMRYAHF